MHYYLDVRANSGCYKSASALLEKIKSKMQYANISESDAGLVRVELEASDKDFKRDCLSDIREVLNNSVGDCSIMAFNDVPVRPIGKPLSSYHGSYVDPDFARFLVKNPTVCEKLQVAEVEMITKSHKIGAPPHFDVTYLSSHGKPTKPSEKDVYAALVARIASAPELHQQIMGDNFSRLELRFRSEKDKAVFRVVFKYELGQSNLKLIMDGFEDILNTLSLKYYIILERLHENPAFSEDYKGGNGFYVAEPVIPWNAGVSEEKLNGMIEFISKALILQLKSSKGCSQLGANDINKINLRLDSGTVEIETRTEFSVQAAHKAAQQEQAATVIQAVVRGWMTRHRQAGRGAEASAEAGSTTSIRLDGT